MEHTLNEIGYIIEIGSISATVAILYIALLHYLTCPLSNNFPPSSLNYCSAKCGEGGEEVR